MKQAIALDSVLYLLSAWLLYRAAKVWWGRAAGVAAALLQDGIIVKPWREAGYETWLRATIGRPADNDRLIASLRKQVTG